MTGKTITVEGQRLKLNSITDYQLKYVMIAYKDSELVWDDKLHHQIIGMVVDDICPQLPKSLYRKVDGFYRWKGTINGFNELSNGLWISFWESVKETSTDKDQLEMAQMQIDLYYATTGESPQAENVQVEEQPKEDIQALIAEIKELKERAGKAGIA